MLGRCYHLELFHHLFVHRYDELVVDALIRLPRTANRHDVTRLVPHALRRAVARLHRQRADCDGRDARILGRILFPPHQDVVH